MRGHIIFAVLTVVLGAFVVTSFTHRDLFVGIMGDGTAYLVYKVAVRLALPLTMVGWAVYFRNQMAKRAGRQSLDILREPHLLMHAGIPADLITWGDAGRVDINGFHQYVHDDDEWREYKENWQMVFWHSHKELHTWMELNPWALRDLQELVADAGRIGLTVTHEMRRADEQNEPR